MAGSAQAPRVEHDVVIRFLVGVSLLEQERGFRATLMTLGADMAKPSPLDITLATVVVLMDMGGVDQYAINAVRTRLAALPPAIVQEGAVAVVNGAFLLVPGQGGADTEWIALQTLQPVAAEKRPPAFTSTIYSTAAIWTRAVQLLA